VATLSVVLTNYNHANVVGRAIEAIVTQSRQPDEFIIQDDGSTDNSIEIILPYVDKYPYVKFVKNEKNMGPIPAMQKVSSYATGEYIYGAGADDWTLPGFFEKAMDQFKVYPQAGICCGDIFDYFADTGEVMEYNMMWADTPTFFSPDELADLLAGRNFAGQAGSIMRRDAFVEAGGYISELKWHSDWFFNHVVAFRKGIVYVPQKFACETARSKGAFCWEGVQNINKQAEVLSAAIRLLKSSKFLDVFPYFSRSAAFFPFSNSVVKIVMMNPDLWDIHTLQLLQHPLFSWSTGLKTTCENNAKKSVERKLSNVFSSINTMIDNGAYKDAVLLLDNIKQTFGNVPAIKELRSKCERMETNNS
jgi:glycosyltransferase involved in cell wall biosynthesis